MTVMAASRMEGDEACEDQRVFLHDVSWEGYETLLALRGERSCPRIAYLDGTVELMSPGTGHEMTKSTVGCVVEAYCLERGILFIPVGSWTIPARMKKAGAEPDECYVFGADPRAKAERQDKPDLAIEVTWSHGGLDKLEIYRRLGVAEVWFWEQDVLRVFVLGDDGYAQRAASACLPELDLALVCRLGTLPSVNEMVAQLRAALA